MGNRTEVTKLPSEVKRKYLGDSVYIEYNGYEITLSTGHHTPETNVIVLDSEVMSNLQKFVAEINKPAPTPEPEQAVT